MRLIVCYFTDTNRLNYGVSGMPMFHTFSKLGVKDTKKLVKYYNKINKKMKKYETPTSN